MDDFSKRCLEANKAWRKSKSSSALIYNFPLSLKNESVIKAGDSLAQGIPADQLKRVGPFLTAASPESHIGPFSHAIDFLVPDGTGVLAAQSGVVVDIVDHFDEWGDDPAYRDKLNYVTIKHLAHDLGHSIEYSQYCHLEKNSVRFSIGSLVSEGDVIAKVGKTGWTDRDHLHFMVFENDVKDEENPFDFRSLKINFVE